MEPMLVSLVSLVFGRRLAFAVGSPTAGIAAVGCMMVRTVIVVRPNRFIGIVTQASKGGWGQVAILAHVLVLGNLER